MITTPRLVLRPITLDDALRGLKGEAPAGLRYAEGYPNENGREGLGHVAKAQDGSIQNFSIVRRAEGDIIGGIGYRFTAGPKRPSVGYDVVETLQGQGFATEALGGLLVYLFSLPAIESVEADALESNIASRRVLEKAGMIQFATRTLDEDGEPAAFVFYEITRPA